MALCLGQALHLGAEHKKEYRGDHGTTVALNGVDLDIMENEFVCV